MTKEIAADLCRLGLGANTAGNTLKGFRSKGFQYLYAWRKVKASRNSFGRLFWRIVLRILGIRYGFQIAIQASIGPGLFIGHFGTIVISALATLGSNCNIAHNVTIGAARGKRAGAPTIGDRVWIGTGAVLTGNITIGSDVLIAPNAFVNTDVPDHSIIIGNPAKVIAKQDPVEDYINQRWSEA